MGKKKSKGHPVTFVWNIVRITIGLVVLTALSCGVEYQGVHYGLSCSRERGVVVEP